MHPLAPTSSLHRSTLAAATLLTAALGLPEVAAAHGGTLIAKGERSGVSVLVQGSAATTASGRPAADLSTVLAGPGTGDGAKVVYYVRPSGRPTFRVAAERDAGGGTLHAEIATAGRGDWQQWDVSALITLNTGQRLRVTNASRNPPGPARVSPTPTPAPDDDLGVPETTPADGVDRGNPGGYTTDPKIGAEGQAVDDISGGESSAPSWALPSVVAIAVAGIGVTWLRRRRDG